MSGDPSEQPASIAVTNHVFEPGDHDPALVDDDHLCHECGLPRRVHTQLPAPVTAPIVISTTLREGGKPIERWQPKWWNRSRGPVVYEYDWTDWAIRVAFFLLGLLLGYVRWHGLGTFAWTP